MKKLPTRQGTGIMFSNNDKKNNRLLKRSKFLNRDLLHQLGMVFKVDSILCRSLVDNLSLLLFHLMRTTNFRLISDR